MCIGGTEEEVPESLVQAYLDEGATLGGCGGVIDDGPGDDDGPL